MDNLNEDWTEAYYEDVINMTYQELVKCIGEPHFEGGDFKIQKEWHFEIENLTHFSIYDWRETDRNRDVTDGKNVEWHIGHDGKPGTLEKVKAWLHDKGVEVDKSMYYKIKASDAINLNIQVGIKDIKKIGKTHFKDEGGVLAIICDGDTSNIEEILLRSILKCFGDEYKIIETKDFIIWGDRGQEDVIDILFVTNLPYEMYEMIQFL